MRSAVRLSVVLADPFRLSCSGSKLFYNYLEIS